MEARLPEDLDVVFTSDWLGPFDGNDLDLDRPAGFGLFPNWCVPFETSNKYWQRELQPGEIGCTLSHVACWRDGREQPGPFVVLEDDVAMSADFGRQVSRLIAQLESLDSDWGLLYLGRTKMGHDERVDDMFLRPGFSYSSYAYVTTPAAAGQLLECNLDQAVVPVDEFLTAVGVPHPRPDVRFAYPPILSTYALARDIVAFADDGTSDTESTSS